MNRSIKTNATTLMVKIRGTTIGAKLNKSLAIACTCVAFCLGFAVKMWHYGPMQVILCLWDFFCPEESETQAEMTSGPPRTV